MSNLQIGLAVLGAIILAKRNVLNVQNLHSVDRDETPIDIKCAHVSNSLLFKVENSGSWRDR